MECFSPLSETASELLMRMSSSGYFGGGLNTECFDTYNKSNPFFTDTSLSNTANRQYQWLLCNEPLGWWRTGTLPQQ